MTDAGKKADEGAGESKMEIRLLEKKDNKLSFICKGITPAYANTLRRVMLNRAPVLAIEDVEFKKNSSALYDEQLAHRLGLVPLTTDLKSYEFKSRCKCKGAGCAKCELKLTLKAKGPSTVLASALKSQDPKVKPAYPDIPLVKLLKGQEVEFTATAVLGEGREHIKWSPGLTHYKYKPEIKVSAKCDKCEKCIEACPVRVFEKSGSKIKINQDNYLKCTLCNACVEACPKHAVSVTYDRNSFVFYVESWGQLKCKDIVKQGVERLNTILDEFTSEVKSTLK